MRLVLIGEFLSVEGGKDNGRKADVVSVKFNPCAMKDSFFRPVCVKSGPMMNQGCKKKRRKSYSYVIFRQRSDDPAACFLTASRSLMKASPRAPSPTLFD